MDDRREQIVAAARRLLAADPSSNPSVRAVAQEAGIGASTLRHYFPTQRALRDAVLTASLDVGPEDLSLHDRSRPAAERLIECLVQLLPARGLVDDLPFARWVETLNSVFGPDGTAEAQLAWASHGLLTRRHVARWLTVLAEENAVIPGSEDRSALFLLTVVDGLAFSRIVPIARLDPNQERAVLQDAVASVLRP